MAAQYAGFMTYAAMQETIGRESSLSKRPSREYRNKAELLRLRFNSEWWNSEANRFYLGILPDHTFAVDYVSECNLYALLFGIPQDGAKTEAALDVAERERPQFPGSLFVSAGSVVPIRSKTIVLTVFCWKSQVAFSSVKTKVRSRSQ